MAMGNMIGKSIKFEDWKGDTRMGTIVSILSNGDYEVSTNFGMALVTKSEIVKMRRGGGIPKATQMKREKVAKVMHEFKEGKLRSGSKRGPVVKDRDQAIAIALSEAGMSKKMGSGGKNDFSIVVIKPLNTRVGSKVLNWFKKNNVKINFDGEHDWHTKGYGEEIWFEDEKNIKNSHFIYIFDLKDFSNRKELEKGLDELENQNEGKIQIFYLDEVPDWVYESYENDNMAQGGELGAVNYQKLLDSLIKKIRAMDILNVETVTFWWGVKVYVETSTEEKAKSVKQNISNLVELKNTDKNKSLKPYLEGFTKSKNKLTMKFIRENYKMAQGGSMYADGGLNTITPVSGGIYVDKIMVSDNRQLEILKDFDDVTFENTIVYELPSKRVLYNGRFEKRALDVLYGDKMATGGGVGDFQTYKLRAEGLNDFLAFLQNDMYFKMKSFTIEPKGFPDVVVTFVTDSSLSEIKQKLKEVPDSHVMRQTVKPINEYTGDRDDEEYAKGGGLSSFNPRSFTLDELKDYLWKNEIFISYFKKGQTGITSASESKIIWDGSSHALALKQWRDKKLTISDYGQLEVDKGDENLYMTLVVYELDGSDDPYEIRIYSKDNHAELRKFANYLIEKFAKGGMIKAGDMVRSTKFKGYEGVVVSKGKSKEMGKNYYFVRLNETLPNGDYQHDIMWADEVEKMATGGGVDDKIRFDVYGYEKIGDRVQSLDETIRVNSYEEAEKLANKFLKENNLELVELYRKHEFVGSIRKTGGFKYSSRYKKEMATGGGVKGSFNKQELLDEMIKTPWGIGRIYEISGSGSDEHVKIDIKGETHIMNMGEIDEEDIVYAKGGHTGWKHKMAQGGGVRKAPFKVGDMVYSYQNPNHKMRISFVEDRGVIDGVDYGWGIKVALKTDGDGNYNPNGTYSKSSKWMSQNSVSKTKKDKYAEGGGVSKNAEYVSKRNIDKVTYNKGKDVKTVTGKDLLDGVYVSKKATTKPGKMYVELKSVGNVDFDDSSERGKNIALKKVNVTSIDEAKKVVRAFIDENDLGGGNWVGGKVFENGKNIGYIAYNGNYFEGERKLAKGGNASRNYVVRYDAEGKKAAMNTLTEAKSFVKVLKENGHTNIEILYPYNLKTVKMAQGGSTGKDKYTVSIDWELSKPRIKYGRKIFKDIYANSNKDAESIAVEQWNSVKANSNKKVLSVNSIKMAKTTIKLIPDGGTKEERIAQLEKIIISGFAKRSDIAEAKRQIAELKDSKMAQGGSMGWKHKMAKGAKLKLEQQYHPSKYLTKEQWEKWNEYVKTGKIDGKKENNMFAVARWVGASVSNINGYEIEQRATKLK